MTGRMAVVVSDSAVLARAIAANLQDLLKVTILEPVLASQAGPDCSPSCDPCHLIIIAASSSASEPLRMLHQASLTACSGQIPLLIISNRPFDSPPGERIAHVDFPFHPEEMRTVASRLLQTGNSQETQ